MRSTLTLGALAGLLSAAWTMGGPGPDKPASMPPLGINLAAVVSYGSEIPFTDLFKTASTWVSQAPGKPWGKGDPLVLDEMGWVKKLEPGGQRAEALFCPDVGAVFAGKTLTCLYDGDGDVSFQGSVRATRRAPGKITLQVLAKPGPITLVLTRTNPQDPVRNVRVLQPGFEENYRREIFTPAFLRRWSAFRVLRFMDWQMTNNSPLAEWADRPLPDQQSQTGPRGVCLEHLVELANATGADPWFCLPHRASDDFVRRFAEMVKAKLKPSAKVYVECSNECWNSAFGQARYCRDQGKKLGLSSNDFEAQLRWYSQRSVEVFRIWEEVFGGKDRLVRVLAAQAVVPWTGKTVLEWKQAYRHADAIAIAPYFGNDFGSPKTADKVAAMTVEQLLEGCRTSIRERQKTTRAYAEEARRHGLRLIAYEGGQHLVGFYGAENDERLTRLFHAANRHPGMKDLYREDLRGWKACGGELFCLYASMSRCSKWGCWGLLEYEGQDPATAPKYLAVREQD